MTSGVPIRQLPRQDTVATNDLVIISSSDNQATRTATVQSILNADSPANLDNIKSVRKVTTATNAMEDDEAILCDATGGSFTVALPNASDQAGRFYSIKRIDGSGNSVTIAPINPQTIDGDTSLILAGAYTAAEIISDGTNWYVLNA